MKKSSGKETHLPMASCGIFYKKNKGKPERIFDIKSTESKQCYGYIHEPFHLRLIPIPSADLIGSGFPNLIGGKI